MGSLNVSSNSDCCLTKNYECNILATVDSEFLKIISQNVNYGDKKF